MRDDQYVGLEFDWIAADSFGRLAVFSTAGFGPVSAIALAAADKQDSVIRSLIPEHLTPEHTDFLTLSAALPFYIYDWKPHGGPYVLKKKPADTGLCTLDSLPTSVHSLITRIQLDFSTCDSVSDIPQSA